jgi:hypothetical protein
MSCKGAIFAAYERINTPAHAQNAWQLFKPYLHDSNFMQHLSRILQSEESISDLYALSAVDLLMEAHELTLPPPSHATAVADLDLREGGTLLDILSVDTNTLSLPLSSTQVFFLFGMRLDHDLLDASHLYRQVLQDLFEGKDEWRHILDDRALAIEVHMLDLIECMLESRCEASH